MTEIAYVNGAYAQVRSAAVSILDRGFQFGDAVYEVWPVRGGKLRDADAHLLRLWRSLRELRIPAPMSEAALRLVLEEVRRRNRVGFGIVYLQISRGAAPRDHAFPAPAVTPTLVITAKTLDRSAFEKRVTGGVKVITAPDIRWARRDIKSVNLLPNALARQAAKEARAFEAWLVDDEGYITEATASNAWIVDADGQLRTRGLSNDILHGVTRAKLIEIARERQIQVVKTPFTIAEAKAAREAFISAATNPATPVVAIDGAMIGDGRPGPITKSLRDAYLGTESAE
jgi:D-alanine transaminase